jgi:Fe-S cluster assembly iron-binding protein IscA
LGLALDEPRENEDTVHANGIDVLIGDEVKPFVSEQRIDYIKSTQGEGFTIAPKSGQSYC